MSEITIKIEGAEALLAPIVAAISKLTASFMDISDFLHRLHPPASSLEDDDPQPAEIPPPAVFTAVAEIPWPKPKAGRKPPGKKDIVWKWTDERVALMLNMRAENASWQEICGAVNKLSGAVIESPHACKIKFYLLPKDLTRQISNATLPEPGPIAVKERPKSSPRAVGKWTDERIDLLLKLRGENYHDDDILVALNHLEGPTLGALAIRDRISYENFSYKSGKIGNRLVGLTPTQNKPPRRAYIFPKKPVPIAQNIVTTPKDFIPPIPRAPSVKVDLNTVEIFIAQDAAAQFDAPIDWQALSDWARFNKVDIVGLTDRSALRKVNEARVALGLPGWRLIATRANHHSLPPPDFGGGSSSDNSKPRAF